MNYNKIHDQYRLGLGLYFKLRFGHISFPGGCLCLSNIPELDHKKLKAASEQEAVLEVLTIIQYDLEFADTLQKIQD
jgi:hypothetical protein